MDDIDRLRWCVSHDPCRAQDRQPNGAVEIGISPRIVLRVDRIVRDNLRSVELCIRDGANTRREPLEPCPEGYAASIQLSCTPHVAFYYFIMRFHDESELAYVPRADRRSTAGELVKLFPGKKYAGFQITVFKDGFATPDWLAGAVMYQVFPDRFARGDDDVFVNGLEAHRELGRPVHAHANWDEPLTWDDRREYDPFDFYGGNLNGIREKLPYIASLGVEVLYLNPLFEARSSHRYDTADYERIDQILGSTDDFTNLCAEATELGIRIVLDAVLSHTGSDSRYFNAQGVYDEPGAMQGDSSPYRSWYDFSPRDNECAYRCWWGDPSLPEVDERSESWQRYMLGSECDQGVLPHWLAAGASGYRLDVADEVPDDVLEAIRRAVKQSKPDAAIIGEVWEDATTKVSYGAERTYALGTSLDTVMNYPLRNALVEFATEEIDAYQLCTFLKLQQANYPQPLYRCLMNFLSTHDVERVRSYLSLGMPLKDSPRIEQYISVAGITSEEDDLAASLQKMTAGLQYALPGSPCLYYGDERGMQGGGDPFCRAPMVWGNPDRYDYGADLTDYYRRLGTIRKTSDALRTGALSCLAINDDVICIARSGDNVDESALIVANRSTEAQRFVLDLEMLGLYGFRHPSFKTLEGGIATLCVSGISTTYFLLSDSLNENNGT